jgi:hypothetical protein
MCFYALNLQEDFSLLKRSIVEGRRRTQIGLRGLKNGAIEAKKRIGSRCHGLFSTASNLLGNAEGCRTQMCEYVPR